jgi:hypothetical protein
MIRSFVGLQDEQQNVLALSIHNGHEMHPQLLPDCGISEAERLREEDPYTEYFTQPYANRCAVYTSRFSVDLNRNPEQCVYLNPEDCWGLPVRKSMPSGELLASLQQDYQSWYQLLATDVERLLLQHQLLLVLDIHSYNHRRGGIDALPDPQSQNPDIILGRSNMPVEFYPWVESLREKLDGHPLYRHGSDGSVLDCLLPALDCRCDVKFTGGWLSRWLHHSYPGRVLSLSVEFKKIWMDEWTGSVNNDFQAELNSLFASAVKQCLQAGMPVYRNVAQ